MNVNDLIWKSAGAAGLLALGVAAGACDRGGETGDTATAEQPAAEQQEEAPAAAAATAIAADLSEPVTASGTAGGSVNARESHTGTAPHTNCVGYMPEDPQHTLEIAGEQALTVVANVQGGGDLTMAIAGPQGTWCNDDFEGLDPGIAGTFAAGTYRVFVGTYSEGNQNPYTLTVRPAPAAPETQTGSLEPGFMPDPFTQDSLSGGPRSSMEWSSQAVEPHNTECRGSYPADPQHVLTLGAFDSLKITASPTESGDLTMIIEGPGGVWCNDDFEGLDPGFETAFPAGEYRIFVGNFGSGSPTPYTLSVTEL